MKARQNRRVSGPTTGCWTNQATCIEEKQRVREPAIRYAQEKQTKKRTNMYTHAHTSMNVVRYDCKRSESESELGNQPVMKIRKENKQTCILVCLSMYVCMRSESESVSHSSPPQLKGVRVISACVCVRARVCWYYFANLSTVSVSLPVHTVTQQKHTHKHKQH
jgi:hypothetical protein